VATRDDGYTRCERLGYKHLHVGMGGCIDDDAYTEKFFSYDLTKTLTRRTRDSCRRA